MKTTQGAAPNHIIIFIIILESSYLRFIFELDTMFHSHGQNLLNHNTLVWQYFA